MALQKNSKNDSSKSAHSSGESDSECEYDSTWENEEIDRTKRSRRRWSRRNLRAAEDMWNYRHNYPGRKMDNDLQNTDQPNLQFYRNKKPSLPDGVYIDGFHNQWWGDYDKLEWVHSYIQWLFPIEEDGMNYYAFKLTKAEIKSFQKDEDAKRRLLKSYEMMLDFYGIKLVDEKTGKVERADNWDDRFDNLNRNTHNNLRITRILKCLGTLGFQHYQAPLVRFFLTETLVKKTLPRVKNSVLDYFMFAVLDKDERRELVKYAFKNFEPKGDFVWCPKWIQKRFLEECNEHSDAAKDSRHDHSLNEHVTFTNVGCAMDFSGGNTFSGSQHTPMGTDKAPPQGVSISQFGEETSNEHNSPLNEVVGTSQTTEGDSDSSPVQNQELKSLEPECGDSNMTHTASGNSEKQPVTAAREDPSSNGQNGFHVNVGNNTVASGVKAENQTTINDNGGSSETLEANKNALVTYTPSSVATTENLERTTVRNVQSDMDGTGSNTTGEPHDPSIQTNDSSPQAPGTSQSEGQTSSEHNSLLGEVRKDQSKIPAETKGQGDDKGSDDSPVKNQDSKSQEPECRDSNMTHEASENSGNQPVTAAHEATHNCSGPQDTTMKTDRESPQTTEDTQKETRAKDSDEAMDIESNSNKDTPGNTEVNQMNVQEDIQEESVQSNKATSEAEGATEEDNAGSDTCNQNTKPPCHDNSAEKNETGVSSASNAPQELIQLNQGQTFTTTANEVCEETTQF